MIIIEKALVIREPWIDLILSGKKSWEMRGQRPAFRGWLGLIRKGSGRVSCIARLVDVGHPLTEDEMVASFDMHRIPEAMIRSGEVAKWTTPWKMADIRVLRQPVPYSHPNGAITLFSLDPKVGRAIVEQLGELPIMTTSSSLVPPSTTINKFNSNAALQRTGSSHDNLIVSEANSSILGEVELTAGNIKHNHFYLGSFLDRFPVDLIGGSNERSLAPRAAHLDWGGIQQVETDIAGDKKLFRRRGWVRQFFTDSDAEPGDTVLVHQIAPYKYKVSLNKKARI